jgi:two-component system nitrogen regulation response regulator NtrX
MSETVLIVDDEDSVRRTIQEWLSTSDMDVQVLAAADAEAALKLANQVTVDLAILDWNLGSGTDGLQLLQDLSLFNADIVAIMVTGYAHRATPLDALRMGVRDYLDKNQDLNRETFLNSVRRQLDRIMPLKQKRAFNRSLREFREAVEKILPLVQATSALNDPVPLPQAIAGLFRFVIRGTGAADGVLLVRQFVGDAATDRVWTADGKPWDGDLVPFAESIAAGVIGMQQPFALSRENIATSGRLQPFEQGRSSLLAVPLNVGPGLHAVMELFDNKRGAFSDEDRNFAFAGAEFGSELLRHALAEQQRHKLLLDAIGAALGATEHLGDSTPNAQSEPMDQPPSAAVMDQLRTGLDLALAPAVDAGPTLELAEAIRVLALRHGPKAVQHCTRMIQNLRQLLDSATGSE